MNKLSELNKEDRPREKAIKYGLESLSDVELIALIISSGTKDNDVISISERIINQYKNLANFSLENYVGLSSIKGIKRSKTLLLLAIFEFHKRVTKETKNQVIQITSPSDVYKAYYYLTLEGSEHLLLLILNNKNEIIKEVNLSRGGPTSASLSIREIIYHVLISKGDSFILVHNHPSDSCLPSNDDVFVTNEIKRKIGGLDIKMKDHIIITKSGFYSFMNPTECIEFYNSTNENVVKM